MCQPTTTTVTVFLFGAAPTSSFCVSTLWTHRKPTCATQSGHASRVSISASHWTIRSSAKARDTVRELLREPFVVWTRWATASGRGKEPRYYGLVETGGKSLVEQLVARGLARIKGVGARLPTGEKSKTFVEKLRALEAEAKHKRLGIWASSTPNKTETETH